WDGWDCRVGPSALGWKTKNWRNTNMASTALKRPPIAKTEMLIRRSVSDVFAAFTDPDMLTKFWLARASGRLEAGARVHWDFIVQGAQADVEVKEFERHERILLSWTGG